MPGNVVVPFKDIAGLDPAAQFQIRRDFEELERYLNGNGNFFDAIIDSGLLQGNAGAHRYPNLTTLLSAETWTTAYTFKVGVIHRPGTPIVETAHMAPPGPLALFALGPLPEAFNIATPQLQVWDFAGFSIKGSSTGSSPPNVYVRGLHLKSTASATNPFYVMETFQP